MENHNQPKYRAVDNSLCATLCLLCSLWFSIDFFSSVWIICPNVASFCFHLYVLLFFICLFLLQQETENEGKQRESQRSFRRQNYNQNTMCRKKNPLSIKKKHKVKESTVLIPKPNGTEKMGQKYFKRRRIRKFPNNVKSSTHNLSSIWLPKHEENKDNRDRYSRVHEKKLRKPDPYAKINSLFL